MGKIIPFSRARALSNTTALERIQRFWLDGNYVPSAYAQSRMAQRGFDDQDLAHLVFETGGVSSHRLVDGLWRYKVSGKSVDGKKMAAVFEFEGSLMTLVTVHDRFKGETVKRKKRR